MTIVLYYGANEVQKLTIGEMIYCTLTQCHGSTLLTELWEWEKEGVLSLGEVNVDRKVAVIGNFVGAFMRNGEKRLSKT